MFATHSSPFSSPELGACSPHGIMHIQMQLQQLKQAPVLNPHYQMVQSYLDILNRFMEVAVSSQGPHGVKLWLIEVQAFTQQLHKRMFQGMPLDPMERQAILNFATYWRSAIHPAYAMATPEAQIVLIHLTQFAAM